LGEHLRAALETERFESAAALVQERDLLVQRLEAFHHPSEVDTSWKQWRDRLAAQHEALADAFAAHTQRATDERQRVETLSHAHRTYGASHASPSGVLHPDFAV
jgi:2-oxoglutarate dehydrogenase complex dehydrogenase (E1) component-like enzyme